MDLPHLSMLYDWAKKLGFTTEPGAEVTNEHKEEQGEDYDEMGESDDSQEEDDEEPQDEPQGSAKKEIDEEKETDEEPKEDVIAKDRIEQLAPSTVPEPVQPEKTSGVDESKTGIKPQTWV